MSTSENDDLGTLDGVLNNAIGARIFLKFLQSQYCAENFLFWQAVNEFRAIEEDEETLKHRADELFRSFIDPSTSTIPVNINGAIVNACRQRLHLPSRNMFDDAQKHIYHLMKNDIFPRFLKSDCAQELLSVSLSPTKGTSPHRLYCKKLHSHHNNPKSQSCANFQHAFCGIFTPSSSTCSLNCEQSPTRSRENSLEDTIGMDTTETNYRKGSKSSATAGNKKRFGMFFSSKKNRGSNSVDDLLRASEEHAPMIKPWEMISTDSFPTAPCRIHLPHHKTSTLVPTSSTFTAGNLAECLRLILKEQQHLDICALYVESRNRGMSPVKQFTPIALTTPMNALSGLELYVRSRVLLRVVCAYVMYNNSFTETSPHHHHRHFNDVFLPSSPHSPHFKEEKKGMSFILQVKKNATIKQILKLLCSRTGISHEECGLTMIDSSEFISLACPVRLYHKATLLLVPMDRKRKKMSGMVSISSDTIKEPHEWSCILNGIPPPHHKFDENGILVRD